MKGTVTKLREADSVQLPAEMLSVSISAEQVEDELRQLSMRHAGKAPAEKVQPGDIVACQPCAAYADGRRVLLFTGLDIPAAADAVQAALGRQAGDTFTCTLAGKEASLTVETITRLTPAAVDDGLIASLHMDGVSTVADYRRYAADMLKRREQADKAKMAVGYVMEQMLEGSEFAYDQGELDAYYAGHLAEIMAEYKAFGFEGTEEDIRHDVLQQLKQGWMAEEVCCRSGYQPDKAAVEQEADQMLEMMSLMGEPAPDRETMVEESLRNAYIMEMFRQLETLVNEKMGG